MFKTPGWLFNGVRHPINLGLSSSINLMDSITITYVISYVGWYTSTVHTRGPSQYTSTYYPLYGYGSITIFSGMNIHLPAILMFTRGTRFWHTAIWGEIPWSTKNIQVAVKTGENHWGRIVISDRSGYGPKPFQVQHHLAIRQSLMWDVDGVYIYIYICINYIYI